MNWNNTFLALSFSFLISSCSQVDVNGLDPDLFTKSGNGSGTTDICKGVDSTFSTKVLPVFTSKCAGASCHTAGGSGGGLNLDKADDIRGDGVSGVIGNIKGEGEINGTSAAQSLLLLKPLATAEGGQAATHTGGQIFANKVDTNYKTLFCWIDGGAKNDLSTSQCTFGEHVYPVFRKRGCTAGNCHDNSSPGGNMNLSQGSVTLLTATAGSATSTFADATLTPVVTGGDVNSLLLTKPAQLNSVTHTGGQVFSGTTDADYQTFKCWVTEGAQNN